MSAVNVVAAIGIVNDLLGLMVNGSAALTTVSETIKRAQAEGRDVSDEEIDRMRSARMVVIEQLRVEIDRRQRGAV